MTVLSITGDETAGLRRCVTCGPIRVPYASYCPHCGNVANTAPLPPTGLDFSVDRLDEIQDREDMRTGNRVLLVLTLIAVAAVTWAAWIRP